MRNLIPFSIPLLGLLASANQWSGGTVSGKLRLTKPNSRHQVPGHRSDHLRWPGARKLMART